MSNDKTPLDYNEIMTADHHEPSTAACELCGLPLSTPHDACPTGCTITDKDYKPVPVRPAQTTGVCQMSKITLRQKGNIYEAFGDDPNAPPLFWIAQDNLADLSAACLSALREQEPKCSPTVFTEIADAPIYRFGETSIEAQGDVAAFNRPKSAQCKCSLLDGTSSLPPCRRYSPAIDGYDGLCITTLTEESLCGHDRACHAEGKSNG